MLTVIALLFYMSAYNKTDFKLGLNYNTFILQQPFMYAHQTSRNEIEGGTHGLSCKIGSTGLLRPICR